MVSIPDLCPFPYFDSPISLTVRDTGLQSLGKLSTDPTNDVVALFKENN